MFSIPVSIRGVDEQGKPFETVGRTITVNRHGARVQLSCPLKGDQIIRVVNQENGQEADFRVVGPVAPLLDGVGEWGIECLAGDENIWDIGFPPLAEEDEARVLLECGRCHTLSFEALSLVEVEVLETAGLLTKPCAHCRTYAPWAYPQRTFEVDSKAYQAGAAAAAQAPALSANRRKSFRKASQLPVRVRDYYGEAEILRTENISQEGFCFASSKTYLVGQGILVTCPFQKEDQRPEVLARIVRLESEAAVGRTLYGVRYEQPLR